MRRARRRAVSDGTEGQRPTGRRQFRARHRAKLEVGARRLRHLRREAAGFAALFEGARSSRSPRQRALSRRGALSVRRSSLTSDRDPARAQGTRRSRRLCVCAGAAASSSVKLASLPAAAVAARTLVAGRGCHGPHGDASNPKGGRAPQPQVSDPAARGILVERGSPARRNSFWNAPASSLGPAKLREVAVFSSVAIGATGRVVATARYGSRVGVASRSRGHLAP